jgi:Skp family chaperone for outer membrane proteins
MGVSPRKLLAIGLSLAGVIYLTAPTQGQAPKGDPRIQPTTGAANGTRTPGTFAPGAPSVIGTIDLDHVFKNYDKVKAANKEIASAIQVRRGELMKLENDGRQEVELMQKFQPGSADYRKHEDKATEIKAKMEAGKEQYEREITLRQADTMATLYKEVQAYAGWVAKQRGITHVMTVSNTPPSGSEPNSVLAAVNRPLIYADTRNDITNDVVHWLNEKYRNMAGPNAVNKPEARVQPLGGAGRPAGAVRPGADQ